MDSSYTVGSLIETVHDRFCHADLYYGHGTDNAWDEAVALVLGLTGAADDQQALSQPVPAAVATDINDMAQLRMRKRVPLAYLLGRCQYMGMTLNIRPGVVVPRSPIGYLLQHGIQPWLPDKVSHVLDLCCGTGCLGLLAAQIYPQAQVTLVDIDPLACQVAGENIELLDLTDRVTVLQRDVTDEPGALAAAAGRYDLILANPPYVDARDMQTLPKEYRAEPTAGLAAGVDGLDILRPMLNALPDLLTDKGLFVGEAGASAGALLRNFPYLPFVWPELHQGGAGVFLLEAGAVSSHTLRAVSQ